MWPPQARRLLLWGAILALAALLTGCHDQPRASDETQADRGAAAIEGIPQDGFTLGRPEAPWTLSVISAATSYELDQLITLLPAVTEPFVRSGRLNVQMRTPSAGAYRRNGDERLAAAALLAAGLQGRYWDALVRFVPSYRAGGADAEHLTALLGRAGVKDVDRAMADRSGPRVGGALAQADEVAVTLGGKGRILYLLTRDGEAGPARNLTGDAQTARLGEGLARELASSPAGM